MEEDSRKSDSIKTPSKPRRRMKKLLNNVQKQLDFYFSDVNLNHDRFLRKEVEKDADGYVDLPTMLKFNKLKQLTSDVSVLAKAVENSSSLQLNDDRTKVKRAVTLLPLENVDARTVYVEEFPTHADHDWLKSMFSTCGTVNYISLPKYKHNNHVKGFAFIEFSTAQEAQKACQVLNTIHKKQTESRKRKKRRSNSESDNTGVVGAVQRQNSRRRRSVSESSAEGNEITSVKSRKRQSSFCSIDENSETDSIKKDVVPNTENAKNITPSCSECLTPTRRKKRSRSRSFSSDIENKSKNCKPTTCTNDVANENKSVPPEVKRTPRKRKPSISSENLEVDEKNTKKTAKTSNIDDGCKLDAASIVTASSESKEPVVTSESNFKSKGEPNTVQKTRKKQEDEPPLLEAQKRKHAEVVCESPQKKPRLQEDARVEKDKDEEEKDIEVGEDTDTSKDGKKKKKNRQHRKKEERNCPDHPKLHPLHVISKVEWVALKKEYKRLQFTKMSELKKKLKVLKYEEVRREELKERIFTSMAAKSQTQDQGTTDAKESVAEHFQGTEEENANEVEADVEKENKVNVDDAKTDVIVDKKPKEFEFLSGTVAALKTTAEHLTRNIIKDTLSPLGHVAYVDYIDGVYQGFVRFTGVADLEAVLAITQAEQDKWIFQLRKLSNEEEVEYFRRAEEKRLQKYDKTQRKKRKKGRGMDKITQHIENAANHIHFS